MILKVKVNNTVQDMFKFNSVFYRQKASYLKGTKQMNIKWQGLVGKKMNLSIIMSDLHRNFCVNRRLNLWHISDLTCNNNSESLKC